MIERREALERISLIVGGTLSTQLAAGVMGQVLNTGESVEVTPEQERLLAEVSEVIIPETDTPGAKEAGAHEFVIRVMRDCYEMPKQQKFYAGLERIDKRSQTMFQKPFVDIADDEKIAVIKKTTKEDKKYFKELKQIVQTGYFSTEAGVTLALRYIPIPGRFEGDVPYQKGDKSIRNAR